MEQIRQTASWRPLLRVTGLRALRGLETLLWGTVGGVTSMALMFAVMFFITAPLYAAVFPDARWEGWYRVAWIVPHLPLVLATVALWTFLRKGLPVWARKSLNKLPVVWRRMTNAVSTRSGISK